MNGTGFAGAISEFQAEPPPSYNKKIRKLVYLNADSSNASAQFKSVSKLFQELAFYWTIICPIVFVFKN